MWLDQLFRDEPINFEKRCQMRIKFGIGVVVLGVIAIGTAVFFRDRMSVLYLQESAGEFICQFYFALGIGMTAGGLMKIRRNLRVLKDPALKKRGEVAETDERNRLLGLRCWAYAGYSMFLLLYLGMLASGFISVTVVRTLMVVSAVYALLLFLFRRMLNRSM